MDKIPVVCLECGKRFKINHLRDPKCPKCKGSDIEVS